MSDELDPNLLRLFAAANQSLPGADFQAQVLARLHRSPFSFDISRWSGFALQAALGGIASGIISPFKLRAGYIGAMAASAAVLALWISLQAP